MPVNEARATCERSSGCSLTFQNLPLNLMLCPQSTHMHTVLTELTGECCFLKHGKVKSVWSSVGTAVEAFTQCYGDLLLAICSARIHISFLLTATECLPMTLAPSLPCKGPRLIPAAWSRSHLPAETSVTAHIWRACTPGNIARNFQNCLLLCLFWRPSYKLPSRSSQVV